MASLLGGERSGSSPALPRKQRDKSPSSLLEEGSETTFTRDRKAGFFSSFMKKKSSSSTSSPSSQPQQNLPMPPKRSSSFREMEQPHKKYEPAAAFCPPPPPLPQVDGLSFSPSHGEANHVQARCCGAAFGQKPGAPSGGQVGGSSSSSSSSGGGSSWGSLAGFFTPRLIKKTLGLRSGSGKPQSTDEKPFPRSNSTSSMSAGLPDLERMALTLPRKSSNKPPLERTASTTSQPENGAPGRPAEAPLTLRKLDEGTAQIRERPKAKLLPRGVSAGARVPGVGGEGDTGTGQQDSIVGQDRQGWSSPSKSVSVGSGTMGLQHNHKVPVVISPTLKHSPADVHLVGVDSQGNRFKLLTDHQTAERDRPRLVKPKCAPPPPPTLRSLSQPYGAEGTDDFSSEVNGEAPTPTKRSGRSGGGERERDRGRPVVPPPQVPPAPSPSSTPTKLANGASTTTHTSSVASKVALRRTRQQAERVLPDKVSKEALLECAESLSSALHGSVEPASSNQVLDAGHQLLDYCSGYVDCIPQMRNKFAFREAVGKLELSLQELRASSGGLGSSPALDNLHSCIKEISDVVQR